MFGKSKLKRGFASKSRSRKDVDEEYTREAIFLGHKTRMRAQIEQDLAKVEAEIENHTNRLLELNEEGMKLPVEQPKEAQKEETPTEGGAA